MQCALQAYKTSPKEESKNAKLNMQIDAIVVSAHITWIFTNELKHASDEFYFIDKNDDMSNNNKLCRFLLH